MWKSILILVLLPTLAFGEAIICGDTTKLYYFAGSVDPTQAPVCPAPFLQTVLSHADTPPQRAFYDSMPRKDFIKVVDGLMVEMTQAEKDAVDAAIAAAKAPAQAARTEMATNEVCANHTLQQISDYWKGPGGKQSALQATITTLDTAIAAVAAGAPKTALVAARDAIVTHMTLFIDDSERQWRYICAHGYVQP